MAWIAWARLLGLFFLTGFYHGLRRGLLLVVKNLLLFFSFSALSKIAHILALAASIFIKFSLFESLAHALSTMSHQWLNDSRVVNVGSQNDSVSDIFASSGRICLQQSLSESSFHHLCLSIVSRPWFYALSRLFELDIQCSPIHMTTSGLGVLTKQWLIG